MAASMAINLDTVVTRQDGSSYVSPRRQHPGSGALEMILSRNIARNINTCLNSHLSFRTDGVRTSQKCVCIYTAVYSQTLTARSIYKQFNICMYHLSTHIHCCSVRWLNIIGVGNRHAKHPHRPTVSSGGRFAAETLCRSGPASSQRAGEQMVSKWLVP